MVPPHDPRTSAFPRGDHAAIGSAIPDRPGHRPGLPLVAAYLALSHLEDWTKFAGHHLAGSKTAEGGILTVVDERGFILGLLDYTLDRELSHGHTLMVKTFVALDFLDTSRKDVATVPILAMEKLADQRGCSAIHTLVHQSDTEPRQTWIMDLLQTHGHKP